jgi:hypothetical protein
MDVLDFVFPEFIGSNVAIVALGINDLPRTPDGHAHIVDRIRDVLFLSRP